MKTRHWCGYHRRWHSGHALEHCKTGTCQRRKNGKPCVMEKTR